MVNPPLKIKSKLGNKMIKVILFHSFFQFQFKFFKNLYTINSNIYLSYFIFFQLYLINLNTV